MVVYIKKVYAHLVVGQGEHPGHGQCVATIVAGSGQHDDRRVFGPFFHDGCRERFCGALHQVNALDGLVLNGILVKLVEL